MADFCNQCAKELGFPEGDFARPNMSPPEEGMGYPELCEGCGPCYVDEKATVMILIVTINMVSRPRLQKFLQGLKLTMKGLNLQVLCYWLKTLRKNSVVNTMTMT